MGGDVLFVLCIESLWLIVLAQHPLLFNPLSDVFFFLPSSHGFIYHLKGLFCSPVQFT